MKTISPTIIATARLLAGRWIITSVFLLGPLLALAQNDKQVWVQRFGTFNTIEQPSAVAVDPSGNIIATGGGSDYATVKYSPAGVPLWTNYYDGPAHVGDQATAIAVASNGNIFVTGRSYPGSWEDVVPHCLTVAYTGEGVPLWTNRFTGAADPAAIAVDGNGDLIVTGNDDASLQIGIWVTIKYSGAGVPLWTNRNQRLYSYAADLAVEGLGDFVVVGRSFGQRFTAIKYSSSGSALWTNVYTRNPSNERSPDGFARGVAVWTNGDIFVTGNTADPNDRAIDNWSDNDLVTIKYSAAGVPLWTNLYGAKGIGDFGTDLALDSSGDVVVTGYSAHPTNWNFVTIKYSNDGTALWTNRYAGPGDLRDTPHAVAVDRNGNVFVTGSSFQSHYGDSITIAYSSGGVPLWTNRYYGPAGHDDGGYDLAVTGVGEVVVLGYSSGDYATIKYDSGFALNITTPRLSINSAANGNQLILAWPTNRDGFTLQSATKLTPPLLWSAVTNPPVVLGGQYAVTNSPSGSPQFFRLCKP